MHIVVADSGVGGVSVVAYAERYLRTHGFGEPVTLTFANAAPANDYGYNSMPSREEKVATFDRFLRSVTGRFSPDLVYVACNTLSVLLPETAYCRGAERRTPVKGIVQTGVELLVGELERDPRSVAVVFGTVTTIEAGTYPRMLRERGIDPSRIVSRACPGLADTISEDRAGDAAAAEIGRCVAAAADSIGSSDAPVVAALACTHYGYRKEMFAAAFEERGIMSTVLNPNESAVDDLFPGGGAGRVHEAEVGFVTRYAIPETTLEALAFFLGGISPKTVEAMRNFTHVPDLF
jgi:glutamate racemase